MASIEEHYDQVLSEVYSWMFGGFKNGIKKYSDFFNSIEISPIHSGLAVDLGAGCSFQSIPLAEAGFSVVTIDLDRKLINEMKKCRK